MFRMETNKVFVSFFSAHFSDKSDFGLQRWRFPPNRCAASPAKVPTERFDAPAHTPTRPGVPRLHRWVLPVFTVATQTEDSQRKF